MKRSNHSRLARLEQRAPEDDTEPVTIIIRWQGDDTVVTEAELANGVIVPASQTANGRPVRIVKHEPPNYEVNWGDKEIEA